MITSNITYSEQLGVLLMYILAAIPEAIVALGAGTLCVFSIEGTSRKKWLVLLSILYAIIRFTNFDWGQVPDIVGILLHGLESIIPAISCYYGGTIVFNKLQDLHRKA
jgi:hypothetical protein